MAHMKNLVKQLSSIVLKICFEYDRGRYKKILRNDNVIKGIISICNDNGDFSAKRCALREYILHAITGYWWDELS